jgi:hypothetical protein
VRTGGAERGDVRPGPGGLRPPNRESHDRQESREERDP